MPSIEKKSYKDYRLYWICSPLRKWRGGRYKWVIEAFFEEKRYEEFSVGSLPSMQLGTLWTDGKKTGYSPKNNIKTMEIVVPPASKGGFCEARDAIYKKTYLLYEKKNWQQICWCYKDSEGNQVTIPCMEIIRSFLARSKSLAYALFDFKGLDSLIDPSTDIIGNKLLLNLTSNYTDRIRRADALHIAWLLYNRAAKRTWDNVMSEIYGEAILDSGGYPGASLGNSVYLKVPPPFDEKTRWRVRAIKSDNNILILEIMGANGFDIPFKEIEFDHPNMRSSQNTKELSSESSDYDTEVVDYEIEGPQNNPDTSEGQEMVDVFLPELVFKNSIDVQPKKKNSSPVSEYSSGKARGSEVYPVNVVSEKANFSETLPGGSGKPASFAVNTIPANDPGNGLQKFIIVLNILMRINPDIEIANQIYAFPLGNSFSTLPDGNSRQYAFCRLTNLTTGQSFNLFEVGRPDKWSVSTILIKPRMGLSISEDEQESLRKIMEAMLLRFNGHWDRIWMKRNTQFYFSFMKHVARSGPTRWAEKIIEKMNFRTF